MLYLGAGLPLSNYLKMHKHSDTFLSHCTYFQLLNLSSQFIIIPVSAGTEDDINPAPGSELSFLNVIVNLTVSDDEGAQAQSSDDFF
jgi:hypothetical protein